MYRFCQQEKKNKSQLHRSLRPSMATKIDRRAGGAKTGVSAESPDSWFSHLRSLRLVHLALCMIAFVATHRSESLAYFLHLESRQAV